MTRTPASVLAGPTRAVPAVGWWELFECRAQARPRDVALVADGVGWTFRDLDRWADRVARRLRDAGARPGAVVACAVPRSAGAVVALLAVAKTGAAALPLDPALPARRREAILADADPVVVLTDLDTDLDTGLQTGLDLGTGTGLDLGTVLDAGRDGRPLGRQEERPAYVIYTSGSTGTPKGVVVGNASLVNLHGELKARHFPPHRRVKVAHGLPFGFDAAFDPLLWMVGGHEVHLVPDDVRTDPDRYVRFVADHRIDVVETVPAHVVALVDAGLLHHPPELLFLGGEAIGQELWTRLRDTPGLRAVNLYGPTECTVFATSCRLDECEAPAIGRPVANTVVEVVDDRSRPVPVGQPGELVIGGRCVALGYLHGERFDGWFHTGDIGRLRPDGRLEWLGRKDGQVKIRGHRVEPGEAEHALLALPTVRQAVVRAEGEGLDVRLVAYVVPAPGADLSDVRDRLREVLPDYLVPSVVALDRMPVGPTGKVDRRGMSSAQRLVADLFRAVLGDVRGVTPTSDFLDLGGHSLAAAALAARLRVVGVPCSTRDVLTLRTVARLAGLVTAHPGKE
ncbi:amino acid adenylation domain-containing protein [Saccharothrix sp.]|uniref:amino acid adenylation domain-containing protein n=1 Tax=Saccharothrix sp. TaxID=1873460 RepID=UPI002811AD54|nr:amino acid adenylation domain-containing protein [Saccharothrix sp.]